MNPVTCKNCLLKFNKIEGMQGTKEGDLYHSLGHLKLVPSAGISSYQDLADLEARYTRSRRDFEREEQIKAPPTRERETIGNTTRYYQVPGTGSIHGGRR